MMRKSIFTVLSILSLSILISCNPKEVVLSPLDYVDMHIGTAKKGHTIISTARPFALVKPGPDTEMRRNYLDAKYITGFSQLHISGTGGNAQSGTIGVLPTNGELKVDPKEYRSSFDPHSGVADVDFYSMLLKDYNVKVEVTSTDRVALYRFIFPSSEESHILINISHAFNKFRGGEVNIVNETSLEGTGKYNGYHGSDFDIAYYIELDRACKSSGVWREKEIERNIKQAEIEGDKSLGAFLDFETSDNDTILMKVAISYVDIDGAKNNMQNELPDWDFERVRNDSKKLWEDLLGQVSVEGGTVDQNTTFYTALYHTMLSPATLSDVDGRYEGFDGEIHVAEDFTYYGEFSLWDTYRTVHPLYAILQPQRQNDMVRSLLTIAEQGGWLPKWSWSEGYTGGMLGDHAVSVIVDSYMKGIRDFDEEFAWRAIRKNAMEKIDGIPWGRRGLHEYKALGYAPEDAGMQFSIVGDNLEYAPGGAPFSPYYPKISGSVSATLEFAYNDFCVSNIANALGKKEDAEFFKDRAYSYKNVYDPNVGFMRPKNSDGSWAMNPFISTMVGKHSQFYCEGNAWTYSWLVPHDPKGLINLMEGEEKFIELLDSAFIGLASKESYYDHGNEPDMHYSYLYNYAGAPWKTQETVRCIMDSLYSSDPVTGLAGDDDVGTMSAWYIFSSMGLYPMNPGSDEYVIGTPLFDKVEISLDEKFYGGKTIVIESVNGGPDSKYIQSAELNGEDWNKTYIKHSDLVNNGHIIFNMGKTPNKTWGVENESFPTSMTENPANFVYSELKAPETAQADEYVDVSVKVTNTGGVGTAHTKLYRHDRSSHYRRGHLVGEDKRVLATGESAEINFSVPLYIYSYHNFMVDTLMTTTTVNRNR